MDFFYDLHESDILDLTSDLHKEAIWFCFADLLQTDLDEVKEYWNPDQEVKAYHCIWCCRHDVLPARGFWRQRLFGSNVATQAHRNGK